MDRTHTITTQEFARTVDDFCKPLPADNPEMQAIAKSLLDIKSTMLSIHADIETVLSK